MPSNEKIYQNYDIKEQDKIQEKTFVIFGANGNWMIDKILRQMGWAPLPDRYAQNFKLKWVESRLSVNYETFREGEQLVNRIPNCYMLTNKLGLLVNLHRFHLRCMSEDVPEAPKLKLSDFLPETYRLDDQKDREFFAQRFKPGETWISKPIGLNQGRGIFLVRDGTQYKNPEYEKDLKGSRLIQRYITNPLLIDGKKFDIRVYILVASTKPFLVLYRNGYVRLSLQKYEAQAEDITVHLTNQFIQRKNSLYETYKNDTILSFEKFNEYINKNVHPFKKIGPDWVLNSLTEQMKNISLFSFLSVKDKLKTKVGYFDLYGIDFIIDENMKVWLLEVNVNPCLATNCDHLKTLVPNIIEETLNISLECFEKCWDKLPLLPCNNLRNFQVLYYDLFSGFDYTKNPLSYSMKGLPSPTLSLATESNNVTIPRKKNIISVVFEQEIDKNPKKNTKSMFEVSPQVPIEDSDEAIDATPKHTPTVQTYFSTSGKITKNIKPYPKAQTFIYEPVKEANKTSPPQYFNETESKTSKFLIKTDGTYEEELKNKLFQNYLTHKKLTREHTEPKLNFVGKIELSKNYNILKDEKEVTPSKETPSNNICEPSQNNKKIKKSSHIEPNGYYSDSQSIMDSEGKSLYFSGQSPSKLKSLLKNNYIDTKNLTTMKILKTLRPPTSSSIKPDYIATNKLLLQTMSKMNAERKIKNLQDTFYNQSITQHDL